MKFSKLLMPTLAAASVGAIVAPVITSCGNSGYGGIEVTQAQFEAAVAYFNTVSTSTNYTAEVSVSAEGETGSSTIKVISTKEAQTVEDTTLYYQGGDSPKIYNPTTKTWTSSTYLPSAHVKSLVSNLSLLEVSEGTFKNGAYYFTDETSSSDLIVAIKKYDTEYRLTHIEASTTPVGGSKVTAKVVFSDYDSTKIEDYPA